MIFYGSKIVWDNSTMEWNFFITTVFKCQQGMRQQEKKKKILFLIFFAKIDIILISNRKTYKPQTL